jgi:hypothetical protein
MLGRATRWVGLMVWVVGAVLAQQLQQLIPGGTGTAGPTGTVIGRVMCSDTQRPARFARVLLQRVPTGRGVGSGMGDGGRFNLGVGMVETALDGSFVVAGIAPGDYFVSANSAGYVPEREMVQAEVNAGMSVEDILAKLPVVHVTANGVASVTATMNRGATVAGQVQWEDGSLATGVVIAAISTAPPQALPAALEGVPSYGGTSAITDDRGNFRIAGLPAGEYVLRALLRGSLPAGIGGFSDRRVSFSSQIVVWAPGVFHRSEATALTVKMGEERDDVRMVLNLGGLRAVAGHVDVASGPGVTTGRVGLTDVKDNMIRLGSVIEPNGDFWIGYVPPGTYALQVTPGGPTFGRGGQGGGSATVTYQPVTQTVVVGETDVTGVAIILVPAQAAP